MNNASHYDPVAFVRSSFVKICEGNGCRAAALNHILYWIAKKAINETRENIQEGRVMYYATTEELTKGISNAWGVCKVRKEVNTLVSIGLLGRGKNPTWGADRTKHFFFGKEQCAKLLEICNKEGICLLHVDLPKEIVHLIKSSNANDKSIKCLCNPPKQEEEQMINLSNAQSGCEHNSSEQMMKSSEHLIDPSLANDKSIGAITKVSTKITTKDYNLDSKESSLEKDSANQTLAPDVASALSFLLAEIKDLKRENAEIKQLLSSSKQEPTGDTNVPNTPSSPTSTRSSTPASSSVRNNPSTEHDDTSSSAHGMEDIKDVEQVSIQDKQSNPIANGATEQATLIEMPDNSPIMPSESTPWNAEKMVQITEAKRFVKDKQGIRHQGERFLEKTYGKSGKSQRDRQKEAAKKILDLGITEEQYIMAYDDCNTEWWNDNQGSLTVETMIAKTPRKIIRVIELLEKIESKGSSRIISFQDRQPKQPATAITKTVVTAKVDKSISDKNLEEMLSKVAAMQGVM